MYSDKYKNRLQSWTDYFTCAARAGTYTVHEDGDEVVTEEKSVTFSCRWCPELAKVTSKEYRIVFDGHIYDILSVDPMNYTKTDIHFACRREKRGSA